VTVPDGPDIMHWTFPLPIRVKGARNIYTIHDLVPLRLPYTSLDMKRRTLGTLRGIAASADHIVTVSEASKRDIVSLLGVPEEKVTNTYQAVELPEALTKMPVDMARGSVEGAFGLSFGNYWLFYGAIEPKKNVMRILDAHAMAKNDLPLVIVGRNGRTYEKEVGRIRALLGDPRRAGRIRRHEYLPFEHLMLLLKGARALVFPSLYEGFGLPVLEAMLMGVPVITANSSSLPEVAGDAALLVDPCDVGQIADAMDRLAGDDALRASLVRKGAEQVQRFSPERYLQRLEEGYRRALGDTRHSPGRGLRPPAANRTALRDAAAGP
jgi:glycosyltransferase involved in cell wall biosynthesis